MTNLDSTLNKIENKLSLIAAIPIVGTAAGLTKILFGTAQLVIAVAATIFASAYALYARSLDPISTTSDHIVHGAGNILAGTLESIPVVQTVLYFKRFLNKRKGSDRINYDGQGLKFYPYSSLKITELESDYDYDYGYGCDYYNNEYCTYPLEQAQ